MQDYWQSIKNKIKRLGKAAFRIAGKAVSETPVVQYKIQEVRQRLFFKVISYTEKKLNEVFKTTLVNALINFSINASGVLILVFKPFGILWSRVASISFFSVSLCFFIYRCIMFAKNYGKTTVKVLRNILKIKSFRRGIRNYVFAEYPKVAKVYHLLNKVQPYVPVLEEIPEIEEVVTVIIQFFWKKLAFFFSGFVLYSLLLYWVLKPYLIYKFGL